MIARDRAILTNLERFRVMSRDDIIDIHFQHLKNPICQTNKVMNRLRLHGYVKANTMLRKYLYFPEPGIKLNSSKIDHFLEILQFYKSIRKHEEPKQFDVEPKFSKGMIEPDVFMIWSRKPMFVEIQRERYGKKKIKAKMDLYQEYYFNKSWEQLPWQPENKKVFPAVWMITDYEYKVTVPFKLIQTKTVDEFLQRYIK